MSQETNSTKGKLVCMIIGHGWNGGSFHINENNPALNYDLRYCGRCDREYVHID